MQVKRTSRGRGTFMVDTSITTALWPNWKLHAGACQMIPTVFSSDGWHPRRQGRWEECIRNFERAVELNPRNLITLFQLGLSYATFDVMLNKNRSWIAY